VFGEYMRLQIEMQLDQVARHRNVGECPTGTFNIYAIEKRAKYSIAPNVRQLPLIGSCQIPFYGPASQAGQFGFLFILDSQSLTDVEASVASVQRKGIEPSV